eukprot:g4621.t1
MGSDTSGATKANAKTAVAASTTTEATAHVASKRKNELLKSEPSIRDAMLQVLAVKRKEEERYRRIEEVKRDRALRGGNKRQAIERENTNRKLPIFDVKDDSPRRDDKSDGKEEEEHFDLFTDDFVGDHDEGGGCESPSKEHCHTTSATGIGTHNTDTSVVDNKDVSNLRDVIAINGDVATRASVKKAKLGDEWDDLDATLVESDEDYASDDENTDDGSGDDDDDDAKSARVAKKWIVTGGQKVATSPSSASIIRADTRRDVEEDEMLLLELGAESYNEGGGMQIRMCEHLLMSRVPIRVTIRNLVTIASAAAKNENDRAITEWYLRLVGLAIGEEDVDTILTQFLLVRSPSDLAGAARRSMLSCVVGASRKVVPRDDALESALSMSGEMSDEAIMTKRRQIIRTKLLDSSHLRTLDATSDFDAYLVSRAGTGGHADEVENQLIDFFTSVMKSATASSSRSLSRGDTLRQLARAVSGTDDGLNGGNDNQEKPTAIRRLGSRVLHPSTFLQRVANREMKVRTGIAIAEWLVALARGYNLQHKNILCFNLTQIALMYLELPGLYPNGEPGERTVNDRTIISFLRAWYRERRFKNLLLAMSPQALRVARGALGVGGRALQAHIVEKRHGGRRDAKGPWDPTPALRASRRAALREAMILDVLGFVDPPG